MKTKFSVLYAASLIIGALVGYALGTCPGVDRSEIDTPCKIKPLISIGLLSTSESSYLYMPIQSFSDQKDVTHSLSAIE